MEYSVRSNNLNASVKTMKHINTKKPDVILFVFVLGLFILTNLIMKLIFTYLIELDASHTILGFDIYFVYVYWFHVLWIYSIYDFTTCDYVSILFNKLGIENIVLRFIIVSSFGQFFWYP
jgi:hypothetical protein